MTPGFSVVTTPHFDRLARSLGKQHSEFTKRYKEVLSILSTDPYNRSKNHPIRKLRQVSEGQGQYRLRLGRFRFRYDILGTRVVLAYCGLRREDTYK